MLFVEVAVFLYYGFWINTVISVISIVSIWGINIALMISYLKVIKNNEEMKSNKLAYKNTH